MFFLVIGKNVFDLTLLTATGERQEAFDLCQRWMQRQTFEGSVRWVIVDDGEKEQKITFNRKNWNIEVIRPTPYWEKGQNTQHRNLLSGLRRVGSHERLLIIEDDDWYGEHYLNDSYRLLNDHFLVGECLAKYFNVKTGKSQNMLNMAHASLCSTGMKGAAIDAFKQSILSQTKFIDMHLWKRFRGTKKLVTTDNVVGIKGMPGRGGIGCGHIDKFGSSSELKNLIGEDAKYYGFC